MSQKSLREMDANEFLAMVDTLMENQERQVGEDPVSRRAVSEVKNEIRRRIMENGLPGKESSPVPITVEVEKVNLDEIIPSAVAVGAHFHGTPYLVTLVGTIDRGKLTCRHGFLSRAETEAFLAGLVTAGKFGLTFREIPDLEDVPDKEPAGGGTE